MNHLVKAYISLRAIRHNARLMLSRARAPLCAVVKANAYGHDVAIATRALKKMASFWAVATLPEAVELRRLRLRAPILLFRPLDDYAESEKALNDQIDLILKLRIRPTIVNRRGLELLAGRAARRQQTAVAHIKVDSGIGRNGCPLDAALALVADAAQRPGLKLEGLYSHFATADEQCLDYARYQLAAFKSVIRQVEARGIHVPVIHMANSGAVFNLPGARFDMIRPGIALYGYGGEFIRGSRQLQPALKLEAPVVLTKWIGKGEACGYGCTFIARRRTRVGLLPLGYADGYDRRWSNAGQVDFGGRLAPVIGRVSMDLTIVNLTGLSAVQVGSRACVISNRREAPHSVESMARRLDTIPHEITCALGNRVQRVMVD